MGLDDPVSLHYAKWSQFVKLFRSSAYTLWAYLQLASFKETNGVVSCKIACRFFDSVAKSNVRTTLMMLEDCRGKRRRLVLEFPYSFCFDVQTAHKNSTVPLSILPLKWKAFVIDKLCEMSDAGMKVMYVKRSLDKSKKDKTVTLMDAHEGSKLQVEAELAAAEFLHLDENVKCHFEKEDNLIWN